jgi:hypothetical protein
MVAMITKNKCLKNDIIPLFELVGENRMVLKYPKNDLILLNLRNNLTGEYLDNIDYDMDGINIVENVDYTLLELIDMSKKEKYIEGWVVQFDDDTLLKIKTEWYYNMSNYILSKLGMKRHKNKEK